MHRGGIIEDADFILSRLQGFMKVTEGSPMTKHCLHTITVVGYTSIVDSVPVFNQSQSMYAMEE